MKDWKSVFEGVLTDRQIKVNESMKLHTTYGIGGLADVFVLPQSIEELKKVLQKAAAMNIPVTVIGGGTNTLVSDKGIRGITICTTRIKNSVVRKGNTIIVTGGAGTGMVSRFAQKQGLSGLEFAAGTYPSPAFFAFGMNDFGNQFYTNNAVKDLSTWSDKIVVSSKGYMLF